MENIRITERKSNKITEYYITFTFPDHNDKNHNLSDLINLLITKNIKAVYAFGFGNNCFYPVITEYFYKNNFPIRPITWVEGTQSNSTDIDGLFVYGISGTEVSYIIENDLIIGSTYDDDYATYLFLGGIGSGNRKIEEKEQTLLVFQNVEKHLESYGMDATNIVRTWFYNKDILSWYKEFNIARTQFFNQKKIFEKLVPASTGIDGDSPFDSSLTAGFFAIKPKNNNITIEKLVSPLQGPATDYGSSFSRAIEVKTPDYQYITISGTASIDATGNTIHLNDTTNQIIQTIETIREILLQRNMSFSDVTRAFAYVKNEKDMELFTSYMEKNNFHTLPLITVNTTICRADLLFELEVDAIKSLS